MPIFQKGGIHLHKRSHKLLAAALLRGCRSLPKRFERAFLVGSVQPDLNPFSYLKGSLHGTFLRGHNFSNSAAYVRTHIRTLQHCSRWGIWQYYTLGKLTHYLADAFTYVHNPQFPHLSVSHHQYERRLRLQLQLRLKNAPLLPSSEEPAARIEQLHRQYTRFPSCIDRDIDFILFAASLLTALIPDPQPFYQI